MRYEEIDRTISGSLRRQLLTALVLGTVLVGGFGGAAAYAEIHGAVIAAGKIIVLGRAREVEHPDGGIIGEIRVREGDKVEGGQLLFRLDGTVARANLGIIEGQLAQLLAQEARLLSEQSGRTEIVFPSDMEAGSDERRALLEAAQVELMSARANTRISQKAQLTKQIEQYAEQISALEAQRAAVGSNITLVEDEVRRYKSLSERRLVVQSQLITVQREMASLLGSQASLSAEIIEIQQASTQAELRLTQVNEEFYEGVLNELDQKRIEIAKLKEERVAAKDKIARLDIRSPMTGYLHQLNVHTVGAVASPGETLVNVIPIDDELIVEAMLSPADVDQVYPGQNARIRLSGLNQRVTPELFGTVIDVTPDLTHDERTGNSFYVARLRIPEQELDKVGGKILKPGMPAEVFMQTGSRSILSYMVKPVADQIRHAMRES